MERLIERLSSRVTELETAATRSNDQHQAQTHGSQHPGESSLRDNESAPLFVLREVTAESGIRTSDRAGTTTPSRILATDVILQGVINAEDAVFLLSIFQQHYGRWVSLDPELPTPVLLKDVRRSPLLLSACCLIAVRHTSQDLAARLAPNLLSEAKSQISAALLTTPQPVEFLKAALLLCMWSTTIARIPLSIDSWLLSSFALQHGTVSGFGPSAAHLIPEGMEKSDLDTLCVWNHLCLAHLHYCVGTGRKAVLDQEDLKRCRLALVAARTSNFESRMVAEVFLYWIVYESSRNPVDLPKTQSALRAWKEEWKHLLGEPRSQFIQMGYHFAQLLAYDRSLKSRSAAVREALLNEMVRLSTTIIKLAMDTTDERTRHLSDHIYHMITFAAVTIIKLLHKYEEQLRETYSLEDLDGLVLSLATWLHAIGLPCHIAYTMGDVVAAFHKKLHPDTQPSPSTSYADVNPTIQDDFAQFFPELFGNSPLDPIHIPMLPDFQSIP